MTRLRTDESGFTLPELLVSMAIALMISLATFTLVEVVMKRSGQVADRVDTNQRARTTMDLITRQVRSQVCTERANKDARTMEAAGPASLSMYVDFSDETLTSKGQLPAPDLRKLTFDPTARTLVESVTKGTRAASGNEVTFPTTGATTRTVLTNVIPVETVSATNRTPVYFRYFKYDAKGEAKIEIGDGSRALTEDELGLVAKITLRYRVLTSKNQTTGSTELRSEIYVRGMVYDEDEKVTSCTAY